MVGNMCINLIELLFSNFYVTIVLIEILEIRRPPAIPQVGRVGGRPAKGD